MTQQTQKKLLEKVLVELNHGDRELFDSLSDSEVKVVLDSLAEYKAHGKSDIHHTLWELDYLEKPVTFEQFITDHNYLGKVGPSIYEPWLIDLDEVLAPDTRIIEWIMCLSGDTKVPLLDGTIKTLKELHESHPEGGYEVYSCNYQDDTVAGIVSKSSKFAKDQLYKVTLDDGTSYRGNLDHEFLCKDGVKRKLRDLRVGDSLMPFKTKYEVVQRVLKQEGLIIKDLRTLYTNHTITSIEKDGVEHVYCLTVPEYGNFAICDDDRQGIFSGNTGAIGIGKSTVANIALSYKLYKVMCLREPVKFYDLLGDGLTTISFNLFNETIELAYKVNYKQFQALLLGSPWFKDKVHPNRTSSWVDIGGDLAIGLGSQAIHALGQAVLGGLLDEADFSRSVGYNQVTKTYTAIYRRIESRFLKYIHKSGNPALLMLMSSAVQDSNSFLNQRIEKAKEHPERTKVSEYAQWDVKPIPVELDTGTFVVYLGGDVHPPKILLPNEEDQFDKDQCIDVPNLYRDSFEDDIDEALLDLAGKRVGTKKNLYLRRIEFLHNCVKDRSYGHPFTAEILPITIDSPVTLQDHFKHDQMFRFYSEMNNTYAPIVNPTRERFLHIDLAKNGDLAGIGCVHFSGFIEKELFIPNIRERKVYQLPTFYLDFCIGVDSTKGSEIDFEKIREFIMYLKSSGMKIGGISYDSWQSTDSLQIFKKSGMLDKDRVITLSIDRTPEPSSYFRSVIVEGRFSTYMHKKFFMEVKALLRDPDSKKVDHPDDGCFTGDTKISLLNGTERRIDSFTEGDEFWVYGCKPDGTIVPSKAKALGVTKVVEELVEVTLDNRDSVRCTLDHKFMLRDGTYTEAQFLTTGDSLMPLYRDSDSRGYEVYTDNITGKLLSTHKQFNVFNYTEDEVYNRGLHSHHMDFNKRNNEPSNLELLTNSKHTTLHLKERWKDPSYRSLKIKFSSSHMKEKWKDPSYKRLVKEGRDRFRSDPKLLLVAQAKRILSVLKPLLSVPSTYMSFSVECRRLELPRYSLDTVKKYFGSYEVLKLLLLKDLNFDRLYNHKVAQVKFVKVEFISMYDIETSTSNFALTSGVFVHNSKDIFDGVCGAVTHCGQYYTAREITSKTVKALVPLVTPLTTDEEFGVDVEFHLKSGKHKGRLRI